MCIRDRYIRYQIKIGSKISDAVKHINKTHLIHCYRKENLKFVFWSFEKSNYAPYDDYIVTKKHNENILYAQYGCRKDIKKLREKNAIKEYTSMTIILLAVILFSSSILFYNKLNPQNTTQYEVVTMKDGVEKLVIGNYKNCAILMDFKYYPSEENKKNETTKKEDENIGIIKGKYTVESIEGNPIQLKKFKNVIVVEGSNSDEKNEQNNNEELVK